MASSMVPAGPFSGAADAGMVSAATAPATATTLPARDADLRFMCCLLRVDLQPTPSRSSVSGAEQRPHIRLLAQGGQVTPQCPSFGGQAVVRPGAASYPVGSVLGMRWPGDISPVLCGSPLGRLPRLAAGVRLVAGAGLRRLGGLRRGGLRGVLLGGHGPRGQLLLRRWWRPAWIVQQLTDRGALRAAGHRPTGHPLVAG